MVMAVSGIHLTTSSCTALDTKPYGGICNEKGLKHAVAEASGE